VTSAQDYAAIAMAAYNADPKWRTHPYTPSSHLLAPVTVNYSNGATEVLG
jgi:hypothetical protein